MRSLSPKMYLTRPWVINTVLLLISIVFSVAAFIAVDYVYTATVNRRRKNTVQKNTCRLPDPVRHHAFQFNCTGLTTWGASVYEISINSLGFRDEKNREVLQKDTKPLILMLGDSFTEGCVPGATPMSAGSRQAYLHMTSLMEVCRATRPPATSM